MLEVKKEKAVVLGAGGAACAVLFVLKDMGFKHVILCNRTQQKAAQQAARFGAEAASWEARNAVLSGAELLVNTTSLGMKGSPRLEINLDALSPAACVYDLVYNPRMTPLVKEAKARGCHTATGLGMLIYQAVPCFEAWFGARPQVTDALETYLEGKLA